LSDVVQPGAALYGLESHLQGKVVTFGGGYALWRDGILIGGLGTVSLTDYCHRCLIPRTLRQPARAF
ncbi:hypothetical protein ONQ60_25645, partial [Salmonella enterica subsp. enterica serovar Virginia]|nr:hypothetical protein [Salmonella enterica subsp. enterica serovar Virginia]